MGIRDRVKGLRRVRAGDLVPNPKNWNDHPAEQREALREALADIGFADVILARELEDGRLLILNGHLRQSEVEPDAVVPVVVLDVTEAEGDKLLATLDPLGRMATANAAKLDKLLDEIDLDSGPLGELLVELAGRAAGAEGPVELKKFEPQKPPVMAWVLVGIPTVRFGEIAADVERLAAVPGVRVETTVGNG